MPSEIPPTPKISAITPVRVTKESTPVKASAFMPPTLSEPISIEMFEQGVRRLQAHYPVHSESGKIAEGLQAGLELDAEKGLPLSKMSRALASALAKLASEG